MAFSPRRKVRHRKDEPFDFEACTRCESVDDFAAINGESRPEAVARILSMYNRSWTDRPVTTYPFELSARERSRFFGQSNDVVHETTILGLRVLIEVLRVYARRGLLGPRKVAPLELITYNDATLERKPQR